MRGVRERSKSRRKKTFPDRDMNKVNEFDLIGQSEKSSFEN